MQPASQKDISQATPDEIRAVLAHGDGDGVKIAIIDSGVELSHPAMAGVTLLDDLAITDKAGSVDISPGAGVDVFGHGTAIASIILKHAPKAQLGSFRVLTPTLGSRNYLIRDGVKLAIEKGYQVLNCSFGCRDDDGRHAMVYKQWLDVAYLRRVHVVAACNNDNVNIQEWPGYFHSCINVNMADSKTDKVIYRNDHLVEFAATGVDQTVPWKDGSYKTVSGSSFATPVVTALLARLLGVYPGLSVVRAKAILQDCADAWQNTYQHGNVPI